MSRNQNPDFTIGISLDGKEVNYIMPFLKEKDVARIVGQIMHKEIDWVGSTKENKASKEPCWYTPVTKHASGIGIAWEEESNRTPIRIQNRQIKWYKVTRNTMG